MHSSATVRMPGREPSPSRTSAHGTGWRDAPAKRVAARPGPSGPRRLSEGWFLAGEAELKLTKSELACFDWCRMPAGSHPWPRANSRQVFHRTRITPPAVRDLSGRELIEGASCATVTSNELQTFATNPTRTLLRFCLSVAACSWWFWA